jgi:putative oxidoreductase
MTSLLEAVREKASRPSTGYDLLRIYLGVALLVRGAIFVAHPDSLLALVGRSGDWLWPMALGHYVAIAHLCGGLLLALGLATRLAAAAQIPILVGAVFFVHWNDGLLNPSQSLELAGLVLAMLICYATFGAGSLSLDELRRRARNVPEDGEGRSPDVRDEVFARRMHEKPSH